MKTLAYVHKIVIGDQPLDGVYLADGTQIIDYQGNFTIVDITLADLTATGDITLGDASTDTLTVGATSQFNAPITVGVNDTGYDVKLFGATAGAYLLWDESADDLILAGVAGLSVAGVTTLTGKVTFGLNGGAASASGILMGVGTSVAPATTAVAGSIFAEFRTQSTAISGDSRGLYWRHDINGAGGGGECVRAFAKVTAAASTVRGAHISLDLDAAGTVSGFGAGVDAQVLYGAAAYSDTLAAINTELYMSAGSTITGTSAFIRGVIQGDATAVTNANENAYLMSLNGLTAATGNLFHANTAADATHGLLIDVGGTPYAILLTNVIPS